MPEPVSASWKSLRARRSVTEFGSPDQVTLKAYGLYETSSVQDRIKQWQEHGAASAPPPDVVSVLSAPRSETSITPEPLAERSSEAQNRPNVNEQVLKSRRAGSNQHGHSSRMRSASTPRKRVVSDEHWKSQRDSKQERHTPIHDDGDVEMIVPRSASPRPRAERPAKKTRAEREERRRRRMEARSSKLQEVAPVRDDAVHGPEFPDSDRDSSGHPKRHAHAHIDSIEGRLRNRSPSLEARSSSELNDNMEQDGTEDQPRSKSKYVETLGRPPTAYQDVQMRSKKGSFLHKTKEVLGMSDSTPVVPSRLPSIEAWLDDQPDPFTDAPMPKVRFEDELSSLSKPQKASKSNSMDRKISKQSPVLLDPNKIWDSIKDAPAQKSSVDRDHDSKVTAAATRQEPEASSPTSLKRRSARSARPKRQTLPSVPVETGQSQPKSACEDQDTVPQFVQQQAEHECPPARPTKPLTIVSVESPHNISQHDAEGYREGQYVIKGRITTDEDTMTVLSRPSLRKSTRRKRSARITNNHKDLDQTKQVLEQLAEDEEKYSRELKTLVDGVIPVLLQCVLSKSDAAAAAEFFSPSANLTHDLSFNRPIIDMGVALERLKTLHNRIPLTNVDQLFSWCQTAHKAYAEYLKVWRLAFQDIVINLAPLEGSDVENNEVMERDVNGDIVNSEGETVDIAYLMKRPLVNIRKIGRALSCLQDELPDHPVASKIAEDYRELTAAAKAKHQKEKGRLEDEAAANIESAKCRDIRDLAPLPGISIDKKKRVRARDCFNMTLFHSTGQRMDCRIELVLRDNQRDLPEGGDLLICQVEQSEKWLLFAPSELSRISARRGESGCDLVVMIRGRAGLGQEWHELLALQAEDAEGVSEWLIMLGSIPLPPKLSQVPSFIDSKAQDTASPEPGPVVLTESALKRVSSVETIEVPIGEPSVLGSVAPNGDGKYLSQKTSGVVKSAPYFSMGGELQQKRILEHWQAQAPKLSRKPVASAVPYSDRSAVSGSSGATTSTQVPSSLTHVGYGPGEQQDQQEERTKPQQKQHRPQILTKPQGPRKVSESVAQSSPEPRATIETQPSSTTPGKSGTEVSEKVEPSIQALEKTREQSTSSRAPASAPSAAPPKIPRVRGNSTSNVPLTNAIRDTWSAISGIGRKTVSQPSTPIAKEKPAVSVSPLAEKTAEQQNRPSSVPAQKVALSDQTSLKPPLPPQHQHIPVLRPRPVLQPSEAQIRMDKANGRLSNSPLRHEYNPDPASSSEDSSSDDSSGSEDDSQTSEDEPPEHFGHHKISRKPIPPKHAPHPPTSASASVPTSAGTRTLAPSDSASQGPYRRVPGSIERPDMVKKRAVAMICSWNNDRGLWEPLVENYCSIVISPGLMEAFMMNEAHSNPSAIKQRPLAAFELTPWVPLRKGTGLDITIRSPSTPDSQIQTATNIMLRSHSGVECDTLYRMINWARCNNPTYLELERSRPPPAPTVTFSTDEAPRPRSWFSFGGVKRRNSYRVGNIPPSSMGDSQTTANTTSSAMSALRRLTKSSSFNVNRSSVLRKAGSRTGGSLYSSSNSTEPDSGQSTPPQSQLGMIPGKFGPNVPPTSNAALDGGGMVHNMRIRLQYRDPSSRWVTVGFSRLTILPAVKHSSGSPEASRPGSSGSGVAGNEETSRRSSTITGSEDAAQRQYRLPSSNYTPHRLHGGGREKRIVVTRERDSSQVLFDATLGESCFERISRLGIAVQVWQAKDEVRHRGSVLLGRNTKYLMIFKTHQECAWVFNTVGSYRYTEMGASSWEQGRW